MKKSDSVLPEMSGGAEYVLVRKKRENLFVVDTTD